MTPKDFPRPCNLHSSQYFTSCICHGIGVDEVPYAILEFEGGKVEVKRLNEAYWIEFTDRTEQAK